MIKIGDCHVRIATSSLKTAETRVLLALKDQYPMGAQVEVVHPRGEYRGKVVGWSLYGVRVSVYNPASGKTRDWHFENVRVVS